MKKSDIYVHIPSGGLYTNARVALKQVNGEWVNGDIIYNSNDPKVGLDFQRTPKEFSEKFVKVTEPVFTTSPRNLLNREGIRKGPNYYKTH